MILSNVVGSGRPYGVFSDHSNRASMVKSLQTSSSQGMPLEGNENVGSADVASTSLQVPGHIRLRAHSDVEAGVSDFRPSATSSIKYPYFGVGYGVMTKVIEDGTTVSMLPFCQGIP